MHIGVGLPNTIAGTSGDTLLHWARQADAGPFFSLGVFDRLLYDSYEPMATLAAAAAVTERIHLATSIIIGPLRNTAVLAKSASSLKGLSGGRFTLGIALGARRDDYETAAVPYHKRGLLLTKQLADLHRYWENEAIGPHPSKPKLLVGGNSDISLARVARFADGYMHGGGPPRAFARMADRARAAWSDAGRPQQPYLWGMGYFALGDETVQQAGADYLLNYYAFTGPFAERIAQGLLTTPQSIIQFMRGYQEAGCDEVILFPTSADPVQLQHLADIVAGHT